MPKPSILIGGFEPEILPLFWLPINHYAQKSKKPFFTLLVLFALQPPNKFEGWGSSCQNLRFQSEVLNDDSFHIIELFLL